MEKLSKRVKMRLRNYDYSQNGLYFITICQKDMVCLFGSISNDLMELSDAGKMIKKQWMLMTQRYFVLNLHEFVVMPNHFHAIIELNESIIKLSEIIGAFKSITTNEYIKGVKLNNWKKFDKKFWQRSFYDKIIRDDNFHQKVVEYINYNPAKWCDDKYYK